MRVVLPFSCVRRAGAIGVLLGSGLVTACSGPSNGTEAAAGSVVSVADTATLSAQAVAIGGFTYDTARLVPWPTRAWSVMARRLWVA